MADIVKFKSGNKSNIATTTTAIEKGTVYFAIEDDENGSIYFDKDGTHRILMGEKHSATADIAISDSLGQDITETYITDINFDGTTNTAKVTATLTHGDGSTFTRDLPNAGAATAGIINTGAQTIAGNKTFTGALSSSGGATFSNSSFNYSGIESANGNAARVVWFSDSTTVGKPVYDNDLTYNPSTNTLKTTNFDGLAARATADGNGANIADTYISEIVSTPSQHKLTYTTGSGQDTNLSVPYVLLAGDTMTGTLQFDDVNGIKINSHNKDLKIWEVVGNSGSWNSEFGFHELYKGTGGGNDNTLEMYAHNQTGTHIKVRTIKQDGTITWHEAQNLDKTLTFNATNGIQYKGTKATKSMIRFKDNTTDTGGNGLIMGGGGLVVVGSGESADDVATLYTDIEEILALTSDNAIHFYTNYEEGTGSQDIRKYTLNNGTLLADNVFTIKSTSTISLDSGNNTSIIFKKNSAETGRWNTKGNLIVGAPSNPNDITYKLYVDGSANIVNDLNVGGKIETTWLRVINNSSNNTDDAMVYFENKNSGDWAQKINLDTYNYGLYIVGTGTHLLRVGSTPDLWVGAGKVGIKTAAPGYELDVNGNERIQGCLHIYPTESSYREGIRIHAYSNWSQVSLLGTDSSGDSGTTNNSWFVGNNNGSFYITRAGSTMSPTSNNTYLYYAGLACVNNQWRLHGYVQAHKTGVFKSGLHIWGSTYGNDAVNMVSQTNDGDFRWNDGGPQITFDTSSTPGGSQAGALIFTDHDSAGTGVSFHFVSNQNSNNKGGDLTVTAPRFRARANLTVGQNSDNKTYNFYVNGTSYFNGNVTHNGIVYFANGTTYYINNSAYAVLGSGEFRNSTGIISSVVSTPWPNFRWDTRAGTSSIGTGTTTYTTIAQTNWATLYYQIPAKRLTYATAGDTSSSVTATYYYPAKFFFRQYSPTSTGTRTAYYEDYSLPDTTVGRTGNAGYYILTSKNLAGHASALIDNLATATANWADTTLIVTSDQTGDTDIYYRRPATAAWNYIAGKLNDGSFVDKNYIIKDGTLDLTKADNGVTAQTSQYVGLRDKNNQLFGVLQLQGQANGNTEAYIGVRNQKSDATWTGWRGLTISQNKTGGCTSTFTSLLAVNYNSNTFTIGSQNSSFTHLYNSANIPFIFNNSVLTTTGNLGNSTYPFNNLYIGKANGAGIYYVGSKSTNRMIRFLENTTDAYGNGIAIGAGGTTIIGGGESADTVVANKYNGANGAEVMVVASDGTIEFLPGQNSYDASALSTMTAGRLWVGVNGNTTRENQVGVQSGAGQMYMWSAAATDGNRGIWLPAHGSGSAHAVFTVDTNNNVTFTGRLNGAISTGTSWIGGQRDLTAGVNLTNANNTGSYWPWMRQTNTGSAKWFSFGILNTSFYWIGSATSRTENGYDYGMQYDVANGTLRATKVYGAVWNDYAEYRVANTKIPGKCVAETGDDTLKLSTKRLQPGCEIVSDTFGFAIGETEKANTPIATTGRVLAYPYESREEFKKHIGEPVCSGPNGTVSIMTEEEWKQYPHCIIGTISSVPDYDTWGTENVKVNNRVWIRIR